MAIYFALDEPMFEPPPRVPWWHEVNLGLLLAVAIDVAIWLGIFMIVQG